MPNVPKPYEVPGSLDGPTRLQRSISYASALLSFHFGSLFGASKKAWGWAVAVSGAAGILVPFARYLIQRWFIPTASQEAMMESLIWQIPVSAFLFLLVIMLFHVPFSKYQKLERGLEKKEKEFREEIQTQRTSSRALALAIEEYKRKVTFERNQKETAREELSRVRDENISLKREHDAWKKHNLVFEVDWVRSFVRLEIDETLGLVTIETNFRIHFEKRRELAVTAKSLGVELYEQKDSGQVERINSRPSGSRLVFELPLATYATRKQFMERAQGHQVILAGMKFTEPMSPYYQFITRTIVYDPINTLADLVSEKHFLRLILEASNQDPFVVDANVDWQHSPWAVQRRPTG